MSDESDMENLLKMTDRIMNRLKSQLTHENQKHRLIKSQT
jgi:hypothetical protein